MPDLDLQPHHDGSALYVANQRPELMDKVKIRIRTHQSLGKVTRVLVRQSDSGEAFLSTPFKKLIHRHGWDWHEGVITMWNPEVSYRFFIQTEAGDCYWLNSVGLFENDQPDRDDFKINIYNSVPKWATGAVFYQVFPDRFAKSEQADSRELPEWADKRNWSDKVKGHGAGVAEQFFGGDLKGIEEHLDHLKKIGATVLYMTPFFPAFSNHRYDAASFDEVDPLLGGNKALTSLVKSAHGMGLKVMGDLTANHSGDKHQWFVAAHKKPAAKESDFYYFSERNTKYESWWGVSSLPKFNWNSSELKDRFIRGKDSVVAKWLKAPYQLDGWRIDVANMTGKLRDENHGAEVADSIRSTMNSVNPDSFLIGEFTSDAAESIQGNNYQAAMTYSNFTRPVWRWLWNKEVKTEENQIGPGRKGITAEQFRELHTSFASTFPWHVRLHNLNALDTHDTGRFKTFAIPDSQRVAAGLQFTMPGIPMIFAGDEFGLEGENGEASRTPIPWNHERDSDLSMLDTYAKLSQIRKRHRSLQEGSMRWLYSSAEAIAFVRESKTESVLVIASRGRDRKLEFSRDALGGAEGAENLFGNGSLRVVGGKIRYDAAELDLQIWRLPSAVR